MHSAVVQMLDEVKMWMLIVNADAHLHFTYIQDCYSVGPTGMPVPVMDGQNSQLARE